MSLIMTGKKKSKKHSINIGKAKRKEKHPSYIAFTKEEMKKIKKMRREGATYQQISKKFGCVHSTIGLRFKEINKNKNKNKIKISERDRISFSSEELKLMIDLRKEGKSYAKITKYFNNCSKTVIMNRLKKLIN